MTAFELFSRYFWLICIVTTGVSIAGFRNQAQERIQGDPALANGYDILARGYLTYANIPWIVMGLGMVFGHVPSLWYYFRPGDGNPWVLAWYASIFVVWMLGTYWLFLRGGAEFLRANLVVFDPRLSNPKGVKRFWLACLAGGLAGMAIVWSMDMPLPQLR